jgi:outer membrane protein assembly factor BamB
VISADLGLTGSGDRHGSVVVNNTVFVGSASGKVYGLNAQTGSQSDGRIAGADQL